MSKANKLKIIVMAGGAGYGNIGDEAALSMLLQYLRASFPSCELLVPSFDPSETTRLHNVDSCKFLTRRTLISFLKANVLAIGGAGLVNKSNFFGSRLRHFPFYCIPGAPTLLMAVLAKALRKQVVFYAVGVTDVPHSVIKALLPIAINMCDHISVRDSYSKELLRSIGIKKEVQVLPDPVLNLGHVDARTAKNLLRQENINIERFLVGLSLRKVDNDSLNERILRVFSEIVNWLIEERDAEVVFLPMSKHKLKAIEDDMLVEREIRPFIRQKERFKVLRRNYSPEEIKGMIGQMKLVIGMRLHALVFSLSMNVPTLGIIYDRKVWSFLRDMGQEGIGVNNLDFDTIKLKTDFLCEINTSDMRRTGR